MVGWFPKGSIYPAIEIAQSYPPLKVLPHSPSVKVPDQISKTSCISLECMHRALQMHQYERESIKNCPREFRVPFPSYLDQ